MTKDLEPNHQVFGSGRFDSSTKPEPTSAMCNVALEVIAPHIGAVRVLSASPLLSQMMTRSSDSSTLDPGDH